MKKLSLLAVFALCLAATVTNAGLVGTTVHLYADRLGENLFDPANGFVPFDANPMQPYAVVDEVDASFPEFWVQGYDPISGTVQNIIVDVDDMTITFEFISNNWVTYIERDYILSEISVPFSGVTIVQNDMDAAVSFTETTITAHVPCCWGTNNSTGPKYLVLSIDAPVSTEPGTWSHLKAIYR